MKASPASSTNKKCHCHQRLLASSVNEASPNFIQGLLPHPTVIAEELGECKENKETGFAPDRWGAYERNGFSKPRGLHLPLQRMLNSLTQYLIFDVQTACSLGYKFIYSLTSPPASLGQFSQSCWDYCLRAVEINVWQSPKHSHQIKQFCTFKLWLYF